MDSKWAHSSMVHLLPGLVSLLRQGDVSLPTDMDRYLHTHIYKQRHKYEKNTYSCPSKSVFTSSYLLNLILLLLSNTMVLSRTFPFHISNFIFCHWETCLSLNHVFIYLIKLRIQSCKPMLLWKKSSLTITQHYLLSVLNLDYIVIQCSKYLD